MSNLIPPEESIVTKEQKTCATCKWCVMPTPPYPAALAVCGRGLLITQDPEKVGCAKHDPKPKPI